MTEADLAKLLDACKPVPAIMLHIGGGRSQQERANDAWAELGARMGFDSTTAQPREGMGPRFFTAVPTETETARDEREKAEAETRRLQEIESTKAQIAELQSRLQTLQQ